MEKTIKICDKCKNKIGQWNMGTKFRNYDNFENIDFCSKCFSKFKKFMRER